MSIKPSSIEWDGANSFRRGLSLSFLLIIVAIPLAYVIYFINQAFPNQPERSASIVGCFFIIIFILPPALYLLSRGRSADPWKLAQIVIATVAVLLTSIYLYWLSSLVFFPADILIWSESDFVNDILKFRLGYPLYTAQANNESFTYTPGTQILTYLSALLLGKSTSIPMYRIIQVIFTLLAAIVASLCCRKLIEMSSSKRQFRGNALWFATSLPFLFLIATNFLTNPFVHNLHNDALAQLISISAYFLLLCYAFSRNKRVLVLMAILPAVGFLVKQSLIIWAGFYFIYLTIFDRPRSKKRLLIYPLAACGVICAAVAICYLLWEEHFIYWVFTVLGKHDVSPLRAFQHMLDVWVYIVIGLIGGIVLLRGKSFNLLLGPWLIWLSFIVIEVYTSGVAWMLNHTGPGSLIAGCWFLAALIRLWPIVSRFGNRKFWFNNWLSAGITVAIIILLFNGLGIIRIPLKSLPDDAYRYMRDIEREFEGHSTEDILLDAGSWLYLKDDVIMKDRGPSIGERGYSETGDFSGILRRLEQKRYSKILVRNLHSPDFQYDYWLWRKSSGIRQALLDNYKEIGQIKAVTRESYQYNTFLFSEINILIPKME